MPSLDVSDVNVTIAVFGSFIVTYGFLSVYIKQRWYLGEALPAMLIGIGLGPYGAKFIDMTRWTSDPAQRPYITLSIMRVMIGVQLVIAGFQLPARYTWKRWKALAVCLLPIMTMMWLFTSVCILAVIPKISLLGALVIGSCVTSTDPVLSQAIAKGPFADKFVRRNLREIISAEAGANDGFGFSFRLLAIYLIRHADTGRILFKTEAAAEENSRKLAAHAATMDEDVVKRGIELGEDVGRQGGGVSTAIGEWVVEGWLYSIILGTVIGVVLGYGSMRAVRFALRRQWMDGDSFLLWPLALAFLVLGICGVLGTDDLLACFAAGSALNWNGQFLRETELRHDEVNSCIDALLNFGGFIYVGSIMPFSDFSMPDTTGITVGRLMGLGLLVLLFRRIPAVLLSYKLMPSVVKDWREALFMGYFGPISVGAVFYVYHTQQFFELPGKAETFEEDHLTAAMTPVVMWLVLFSAVVHGLSMPLLAAFYHWRQVPAIVDECPEEVKILSENEPLPNNAYRTGANELSYVVNNRFSRAPNREFSMFDLDHPFDVDKHHRWITMP